MGIENYSKTPALNDQNPPYGWPEGMPPSGVNDSARQNMADTRTWYEDSQWVNLGYPVLFDTDNSFTFDNGTNYTAIFHTGRRIKASGTSTGTIFGTIKTSTHSGSTTVTVDWDGSGVLIDEDLTIYIAALTKNNDSLPYLNKTAKSAVASASTINLDQVRGDLVDISGTTTITTVTLSEGQERTIRFTGILTLTNGSNLVLPSGANITTASGDFAILRGYASGVVRCVVYMRASGKALIETEVIVPTLTASVIAFATSTPPTGFLECDGAAVSRTTYATLFSAIGTTFGVGDGSSTFNLPDMRGYFVRGWDHGRGVDSGRTFGSAQSDDFASHTHTVPANGNNPSFGQQGTGSGPITPQITSATGGSETRPKNIALMYCIKY